MKTTGKDSWSKSVLHQLNKFHSISRWGVWVCPLWGHLRGEATPLYGRKRDLDASLVRRICCLFNDYCHKISIYRLNLTFKQKSYTRPWHHLTSYDEYRFHIIIYYLKLCGTIHNGWSPNGMHACMPSGYHVWSHDCHYTISRNHG